MASSSQKKQTTPKTVTSGASNIPSPRMHSFEDAELQTRKKATGVRPGRDVDVSDGEQHSRDEPAATAGKEPDIKTVTKQVTILMRKAVLK